jgi:glycosyltransferase involved in cell wall biosynthesis
MNILLINYDFPPNPGIGGRRWAKLAKFLALQGHQLHVVKADFPEGMTASSWAHDVVHPNIHTYNAGRKYPKSLSHPQPTWMGKIKFHAQKRIMLWREKGTIYDQSIGWNKTMLPICRDILSKKNIDAIIATGAPWNLLVHAAQLKSEFPHVKLLVDYRDPWLTARNYGMTALKSTRMNAEIRKQKFVFEQADVVSTPYEYLTKQLHDWSETQCKHQPRFATLAHFFDADDFQLESASANDTEIFRLVYAGDIYVGSEPQWRQLETLLQSISNSLPANRKIQLDLYTHAKMPTGILNLPCVRVHEPVGKSIFGIMQSADALLIVLPENKKNERTTKFFEYLPLRKPLLVVAPEGEVTQFVETNRLGIHGGQSAEKVQSFFTGAFAQHEFNSTFDIQSQTANSRAAELIELLA